MIEFGLDDDVHEYRKCVIQRDFTWKRRVTCVWVRNISFAVALRREEWVQLVVFNINYKTLEKMDV
jgi:hypothetical protein